MAVAPAGCGYHRDRLYPLCPGSGFLPPLVATFLFAFLSIRVEDASILDFLRYAVNFLFLKQQYYEWGEAVE